MVQTAGVRFPQPAFQSCVITVGFDESIALSALRERLLDSAEGGQLSLDASSSAEHQLTLRSTSGHSFLQFGGDAAVLHTNYTGPYVADGDDASSLRAGYAGEKVSAVLRLVELAEASVALFGVTISARLTVQESETERLRRAVADAYRLTASLGEGHPVHDFVLRVSRGVEDLFSNLQVTWFQERQMMVQVTPEIAAKRMFRFREWDAVLSGEGVQLTYDRNNKRGLFAGKRSWSTADLSKIVADTFADVSPAFAGVCGFVAPYWEAIRE